MLGSKLTLSTISRSPFGTSFASTDLVPSGSVITPLSPPPASRTTVGLVGERVALAARVLRHHAEPQRLARVCLSDLVADRGRPGDRLAGVAFLVAAQPRIGVRDGLVADPLALRARDDRPDQRRTGDRRRGRVGRLAALGRDDRRSARTSPALSHPCCSRTLASATRLPRSSETTRYSKSVAPEMAAHVEADESLAGSALQRSHWYLYVLPGCVQTPLLVVSLPPTIGRTGDARVLGVGRAGRRPRRDL